jgi:hypothetical protein
MPPTWRERFVQARHSGSSAMTLAQVLRYFRQQEGLPACKQAQNNRLQNCAKITNHRSNTKVPFKRGVDDKAKSSKHEPASKKHRISDQMIHLVQSTQIWVMFGASAGQINTCKVISR